MHEAICKMQTLAECDRTPHPFDYRSGQALNPLLSDEGRGEGEELIHCPAEMRILTAT